MFCEATLDLAFKMCSNVHSTIQHYALALPKIQKEHSLNLVSVILADSIYLRLTN